MWEEFTNWLTGTKTVDSEGQLKKAQVKQKEEKVKSTPSQEKLAKDSGFNSYEEMKLWEAQRSKKREPQTTNVPTAGQTSPMAAHPKSMFQYIADVLAGANEKD